MPIANNATSIGPVACTIRVAGLVYGLSRSRIYELIAAGKIEARKEGRKTLVMTSTLEAYMRMPPAAIIRQI